MRAFSSVGSTNSGSKPVSTINRVRRSLRNGRVQAALVASTLLMAVAMLAARSSLLAEEVPPVPYGRPVIEFISSEMTPLGGGIYRYVISGVVSNCDDPSDLDVKMVGSPFSATTTTLPGGDFEEVFFIHGTEGFGAIVRVTVVLDDEPLSESVFVET